MSFYKPSYFLAPFVFLIAHFAVATGVEVDTRYPPVGMEIDVSGGEPTFIPKSGALKKDYSKDKLKASNCYTYSIQDYNYYFSPAIPDSYDSSASCKSLTLGVVADSKSKARVVECPQKARVSACKKDEYLVMMFRGFLLEAGYDFHFYRQDSNGFFSHQMGGDDPTQLDGNGKLINDPRSANRRNPDFEGSYSEFCSCFCVKQDGYKIP